QRKFVSGDSASNPQVEMIERHCAHADNRFTRFRHWIGHHRFLETLDAAVLSNDDRFHGARFYAGGRHNGCWSRFRGAPRDSTLRDGRTDRPVGGARLARLSTPSARYILGLAG